MTTTYEIHYPGYNRDEKSVNLFLKVHKIFMTQIQAGEYDKIKYEESITSGGVLGKFTATKHESKIIGLL